MKKLIIAFGLMAMISGTTVSVLKWLGIGPFEKFSSLGGGGSEGEKEPPSFIELDPMAVPIFQGEKVVATVHIQVKLETVGKNNFARIGRAKARIRDAFLSEMHVFIPRMLRMTERIDIFILKKRLQMVADRVMADRTIRNVLIQSVTNIPAG